MQERIETILHEGIRDKPSKNVGYDGFGFDHLGMDQIIFWSGTFIIAGYKTSMILNRSLIGWIYPKRHNYGKITQGLHRTIFI